MTQQTKSQAQAADCAALFRARNPALWVVTREEARVESYIFQAAAAAGYVPRTWDVAAGVCDLAGVPQDGENDRPLIGGRDPADTLAAIEAAARLPFHKPLQDDAGELSQEEKPNRGVWILRDMPSWLDGPAMAATRRQMRNLARLLPSTVRERAQAIVVLTPIADVPTELQGHVTVIDWPLPDRAEIGAILDAAIAALPEDLRASAAPNGQRELAIDGAIGLSGEESQACFARSLVQTRKIDPLAVSKEKKRVISAAKLIEWHDPISGGLDAIGGLDNLKTWLLARRVAFTLKAREYGLPAPKGLLLVGIAGCGKSLTAKAIPTAFDCPLLRLDLGALKGRYVGQSEANIRKVLKIIESVGRCVVWLDELEKALQGATSGSSDGGVSADALGMILTWMQERAGEAFVIATCNDVSSLPPELLRKGRFDEIFFVDLPNAQEREQIVVTALRANGRDPGAERCLMDRAECVAVANACEGFTGSEIAALVPDAMFAAFADGERELTAADLLAAARSTVPLSQTAANKIEALRQWAKGRARPATSAIVTRLESTTTAAPSAARVIDL